MKTRRMRLLATAVLLLAARAGAQPVFQYFYKR